MNGGPDRFQRTRTVAILLCACAGFSRAEAAGSADLSTALSDYARQANIELIFDPAQVAGTKVPVGTVRPTLASMLAGTRFTYRQADAHTFVIVNRLIKAVAEPRQPAPSAGPEIVVTGRRSQNVDLVRGMDEIQPYWVASGEYVAGSGVASLDSFLRTRLNLNRDATPLSQGSPSPRSQINLRGFGTDQTLILVDGRRFAGVPANAGLFDQSDLNAIPVEAVDRIEALATSAGGIFGIGATGGVVNVILRRDYDGAFVSAENRVTEKGDGVERRLYGRFGWKSPNGRTRLMVSGSYDHDDGLLAGDRSYEVRARTRRISAVGYTDSFVSNSINIQSVSGVPLTFTASNGGGSLGSSITYLPISFGALDDAGLSTLKTNAGKQDISLAADGQGALASLASRATRSSIMGTFRQDIGSSAELYVDYLRLDDRGYQYGQGFYAGYSTIGSAFFTLAAGAKGNPFAQAIGISFPTSYAPALAPERDLTQRGTIGLIRRFAGGWSLAADGAYSRTSVFQFSENSYSTTVPRVFAGIEALDSDIQAHTTTTLTDHSANHLVDANIRLTGPVATLPGGPATITATGEFRREWSGGFVTTSGITRPGAPSPTFLAPVESIPFSQNVWSAFAEARLPLIAAEGPVRPWRGLTAQLAVRFDRYTLIVPPSVSDAVHNQRSVPALTAGLQARPLDGVMLRGSFANAATPPSPAQLQARTAIASDAFYVDPKRGGLQPYISGYTFQFLYGSTQLKPQRTDTFSLGIVLEPVRLTGVRFSVDYTRLKMTNEIESFVNGDLQYFLDYEDQYPGRIQRAPLTAADQALGYTGGRITRFDTGPLQTGTSRLDSLDFSLSYDVPIGDGMLHARADADWALAYRRFSDPRNGHYDLVGHADGPVEWRANAEVSWSTEKVSIGTQAQFYASYSLADGTPASLAQTLITGFSQADLNAYRASEPTVPMQAYFDLSVALRPQGRGGTQIRATVSNIFNRHAPVVANILPTVASPYVDQTPANGVGAYGDVLGRRFAINVSVPLHF